MQSTIPLSEWSNQEITNTARLYFDRFEASSVWSTDPTVIEKSKQQIKQSQDLGYKYLLEQFLINIPRTFNHQYQIKMESGSPQESALSKLLNSEEFLQLESSATASPSIGDSRIAIAERFLKPLCDSATSVHIIDKWLGANSFSGNSGANWLLNWMLDNTQSKFKIVIHTEAPTVDVLESVVGTKHNRARQLRLHLENSLGKDFSRIDLRTYRERNTAIQFPHDRELNFRFCNNVSVGVALGKGTEIFESEELRDLPHIVELPKSHIAQRMQQLNQLERLI